jgi:hypothetical protein
MVAIASGRTGREGFIQAAKLLGRQVNLKRR